MRNLNNLVRAAIFSALAISAGFALLLIPNVELVTIIIFISGLTLGCRWGILVGGTAEFVFSAMNPLGSGLTFPPLFVTQVVSMMIIGAIGGILQPIFFKPNFSLIKICGLALCGFLLTFIYDSLTTLSYPISAGFDWPQTVAIYISGLSFTILHQCSNAFVFAVGVPRIIKHLA